MPDTVATTSNSPPDWTAHTRELLCPLCTYNLRGLTESRCPECGFTFTWLELLEAEKNKHPYLFEYGKGKNIKTFWKTYWRTCRPRRFWREVNPAQEVRPIRLMVYWVLASSLIFLVLAGPYVKPLFVSGYEIMSLRACYRPSPSNPSLLVPSGRASAIMGLRALTRGQLDFALPPPWFPEFWKEMWQDATSQRSGFYSQKMMSFIFFWGAVFLFWPWVTLLSLMVFRFSMRSAKIRASHLIRTVIYSCDFGLLLVVLASVILNVDFRSAPDAGWIVLLGVVAIPAVTTYRLTIAFNRYLRLHMPFATVLVSQVISFLLVFIAVLWIAEI